MSKYILSLASLLVSAVLVGCGGGDSKKKQLVDGKGEPIVGDVATAPSLEDAIPTDKNKSGGSSVLSGPKHDDADNKIIKLKIKGMTNDLKVEEVEAALADVKHFITIIKSDPKTQLVEAKFGFGVKFADIISTIKELGMEAEEAE